MAVLIKSQSLLLMFLAVFVASAAASGGGKRCIPGGWCPIKNVTDPEVVKVAKFAVAEHNKEAKTNLEFLAVVKGETQVVNGLNYSLVISAKDGATTKYYRAIVYEKPNQKLMKLISFEEILVV